MQHRLIAPILAVVLSIAGAPALQATQLGIRPVIQQTPVWCWAATAEMVLRHFGARSINPAGNFQCGVVATIGATCWSNCAACITAVGTTQNFVTVLRRYAYAHQRLTGQAISGFAPRWGGELTPRALTEELDAGYPVIAGISPTGAVAPSGWGLSQHVVVIVGYDVDVAGQLILRVNDPYPYARWQDPYLLAGGSRVSLGQYLISYRSFLRNLAYQNSITLR